MKVKVLLVNLLLLIMAISGFCQSPVDGLKQWLKTPIEQRASIDSMEFTNQPLTKEQADEALNLLYNEYKKEMLQTAGDMWNNRCLVIDDLKMPFYYQVFGEEPADGRSLYISLHGGGGTTQEENDQQYENQKHLYDATMKDMEGVYLAPRAPSNTWNLWHQEDIDQFINNILIPMAVIKEHVNPNKVYILGYSAGGDGVYQLAPRLADHWAAASMMAGHPNDADPRSLLNCPFAIQVGAEDSAYDRNKVAQLWGEKLDSLQQEDPEGYKHYVWIHEGCAHWMNLEDAVAIPWMSQFTRNPIPRKIDWIQDDVHHRFFYWIATPEEYIETGGEIQAEYIPEENAVNIINSYTKVFQFLLNDNMLDLDKPIILKNNGEAYGTIKVERTIETIYYTLWLKGDPNLSFSSLLSYTANE